MLPDMDALNYPYIRIRDVDWLKRTLLIFPHVVRMTPRYGGPADDPDVATFCQTKGQRGPLLRSADLQSPEVHRAQHDLVKELTKLNERDGIFDDLRVQAPKHRHREPSERRPSVWDRRLAPNASFQIHQQKIFYELCEFLLDQGLARYPAERDSDGPGYIEMDSRLGEAVMATLAFACAENEGLHVVTEFPRLHGKAIGMPRDKILSECLGQPELSGATSGQQVAEFLVYRRCDVSKLSAERIAALKSERDALAAFRAKLEDLAATLPPTIKSEKKLNQRLDDILNDVFREWKRDQANLSNYARRLFGEGVLDEPEKLAQTLIEKAFEARDAQAVGAATAAGAIGAHIGGLTISAATGAAAGFVVALVFRSVGVWSETKKAARNSPFRYLTALEKHGVSFALAR